MPKGHSGHHPGVNGWVNLPSRLVESGIALTVLLGALNNLFPSFVSVAGRSPLPLVSSMDWDSLPVQRCQLAVVLVFVPVAHALRETRLSRRAFMPGGAVVIGALAAYWLAMRATGLSLR